jgi:hypothetical protein
VQHRRGIPVGLVEIECILARHVVAADEQL